MNDREARRDDATPADSATGRLEGPEAGDISDLRSALEFLGSLPGELVTNDDPLDPYLEIAAVYAPLGAGTPAPPPTRCGPAMRFSHVNGFDMPVVVGVLASRRRTAALLGSTVQGLPQTLLDALEHPLAPVTVGGGDAPCHDVILRPPFDLRRPPAGPDHERPRRGALRHTRPHARRRSRDR